MKLIPLAYFLMTLIGCSHVEHDTLKVERTPSSIQVNEGGYNQIGKYVSKTTLFYKEGDNIVIKDCSNNQNLGKTSVMAQQNCEGKSRSFPIEVFRNALRDSIPWGALTILRGMTKDEVDAYNFPPKGMREIKKDAEDGEYKNVLRGLYAYSDEELEKLRKARESAIMKVHPVIDKAIDLIVDQPNLILKESNFFNAQLGLFNRERFLYRLLGDVVPDKKFACGLKGSLEERIKDCSYQSGAKKKGFVLVMRRYKVNLGEFESTYKDVETGFLWGDIVPRGFGEYWTYEGAKEVCQDEYGKIAQLNGVIWRLPTADEYKKANENGIREVPTTTNEMYWTSSLDMNDDRKALLFYSYSGVFGSFKRHGWNLNRDEETVSQFAVRCIGEITGN